MITVTSDYTTKNATGKVCPSYQMKLNPMRQSLAGAWKLDEASGTRYDWTTRNDLTASGSPTTSTGKVNAAAAQLTAASSQYLYANVSDNHCLMTPETRDFTFFARVYLDSTGADRTIASQWKTGSAQSWRLIYKNGPNRFRFEVANGSSGAGVSRDCSFAVSTATWYDIVVYYDTARSVIGIQIDNGTRFEISTTGGEPNSSTERFRIGAIDNGSGAADFWDGRIEQAMWWSRLLTSAEIASLYNSGTGADFGVLTEPAPEYRFCTADLADGTDLGDEVMVPVELVRETDIERNRFVLSTLTVECSDIGDVVTDAVAAGIVGYRCRFYAGFDDLTSADMVQIFGGVVTEVEHRDGVYRITARSYMSPASDKIVMVGAQSQLTVAVNTTDTTFTVADASAFEEAVDTPQSLRKIARIDDEIVTYRGKSQNSDGTWNLNSVVRSSASGFPFPPWFGVNASHNPPAQIKQLPKFGSTTSDTSQASASAKDWMHPVEYLKQLLTVSGPNGVGEFDIPINKDEFATAKSTLGDTLQFRYINVDGGITAKDLIESILLDLAAYPTEDSDGAVGIKLYPTPSVLHAAWKFEESSGTRYDAINSYDLTPVNGPTSGTGKIGTAASFASASSQYLWRQHDGLQPANTSFGVTCWVKLTTKAAGMLIAGQWDTASAPDKCWRLWYNNSANRFQFAISDGTTIATVNADSLGSPATGTWYCITAWRDKSAGTINIKVNALTTDSTSTTVVPVPTTGEFRVGAAGNAGTAVDPMDGLIDELGLFFDHVPTSSELASIYNSGTGIAIETFPDLYPTWAASSVGTLTDSHAISRPRWIRNAERIINKVIYHYDYTANGEFASTFVYRDDAMVAAVGRENVLEIWSKGIRSRLFESGPFVWCDATRRFLLNRAKAHIARFGNPAPVIQCIAHRQKHLYEVADDVTITFDQVVDLDAGTRSITGADAEISKMRHDFRSNVVEIEVLSYSSA